MRSNTIALIRDNYRPTFEGEACARACSSLDRSTALPATKKRAIQGLIAGISNAGLRALGSPQFTLSRAEAYVGVLIDDLTAWGEVNRTECSLPALNFGFQFARRQRGFTVARPTRDQFGLINDAEYAHFYGAAQAHDRRLSGLSAQEAFRGRTVRRKSRLKNLESLGTSHLSVQAQSLLQLAQKARNSGFPMFLNLWKDDAFRSGPSRSETTAETLENRSEI